MSAIRPVIYQILLEAKEPLAFADIKAAFGKEKWPNVGAVLCQLQSIGAIERKGEPRQYTYRLTDETRARLTAAGSNDLRKVPMHPVIRAERKDGNCGCASQPDWPAPNPSADLRPLVSIPWKDEQELPPVIGERYADVMHRIGHE